MKDCIETTAEIVAAYISKNALPSQDLPRLIQSVFQKLEDIRNPKAPEPVVEQYQPATTVKKSIQRDHIVCLECAGHFRTLKRHLATHHQLSPKGYRERYHLSPDYPLTAPAYAARRSELAKTFGLGRHASDAAQNALGQTQTEPVDKAQPEPVHAKEPEVQPKTEAPKKKAKGKAAPQAVRSHPKAEQTRRKSTVKEKPQEEAETGSEAA